MVYLRLTLDNSNKLELTHSRDNLFLTGNKGLTKVKVNEDRLSTVYSLKRGIRILNKIILEV